MAQMQPQYFTDMRVNIKIQLMAMWTTVMFCYVYGDYFELYVPGKTQGLLDGQNLLDSPAKLFLAMLMLLIPALMIMLSVLVTAPLNRILNMVFAAMYTLLMILVGVGSISTWRSFYVFLAGVEAIITIMIFWKALKWPRLPVDNL
jgi:Family of unknown function (DUF6326)